MEGISEKTLEKLFRLQPRCINCGSTNMIAAHHRVFRSEGNKVLEELLGRLSSVYESCYKRDLELWYSIHNIQNLCVLCQRCHTGGVTGVHGGNEKLRQALRNSFTDPITGFNIPYYKKTLPH